MLQRPVSPIPVEGDNSLSRLLWHMGQTSFQARNLSRALEVWRRMLAEEVTIFLGLAGAMIPAGMRQVMVYLIEKRLIDCLVSTGANLFHDCYETLGRYHWQGSENADDLELFRAGIDRIHDVFAPESEFQDTEDFIEEWVMGLDQDRPYTTREFLYLLGERLSQVGVVEGILTTAYRVGLPIYCPAISDSSIGLAISTGRFKGNNCLTFDLIQDVLEITDIIAQSPVTGVIYIGGGTPKNFIQQAGTQAAYLCQRPEIAHKYAVQITTDAPHWGGLSGSTLEEAQSWGKISGEALKVSAYCDATIALPLMVKALAEEGVERPYKPQFEMGPKLKVKFP